ncbi:hypothetical protein [Duganella sp. BJB488]|nr:hypothetical protein [Duganella sp. BJB488]
MAASVRFFSNGREWYNPNDLGKGTPEVLAMDRRISLSIAGIEEAKVLDFVQGILQQQGIAIEVKQGVYYLVPSAKNQPGQPIAADSAVSVSERPPAVRRGLRGESEELDWRKCASCCRPSIHCLSWWTCPRLG